MNVPFLLSEQEKCYQYFPVGEENEGDNELVFNEVGLKVTFIEDRHTSYHFTTRCLQLTDIEVFILKVENSSASEFLDSLGLHEFIIAFIV